MLDSYIRPLLNPVIDSLGKGLAKAEISAGVVTVTGFCFAIGSFAALVLHIYMVALVLVIISRIFDNIDVAVARHSPGGDTVFRSYLDTVTDMLFYAGFVFFFAFGHPDDRLAAAFLLFSIMGWGCAFLTYGKFAEKIKQKDKKPLFHLGNLIGGTEIVAAFILACLFPEKFTMIAVIFGILCLLTTIGRTRMAMRDFKT